MSGISLFLMTCAAGAFAATASPPGFSDGGRGGSHTTEATTAIPSGGSGTYTYSWAIALGATYPITVTSPTSATTTFHVSGVAPEDTATGTAICTITDTVTSETAQVSVSIEYVRSAGSQFA